MVRSRFPWFPQWTVSSPDLKPMDFAVWGYSTQQVATKNNANLEALKISLKKAWDDLDVNTCVPSLTRTRRDSELSSRLKVDDLKTVYATYLLLFNEHFVRFVENNLMFKRFYTVLNVAPYLFPTLYLVDFIIPKAIPAKPNK
uniref:Uncharacterized protein n=1 Tax=Caenorhabditis japonica TaxID=281687 RepID=A0A8R1E9S8_CAEJA